MSCEECRRKFLEQNGIVHPARRVVVKSEWLPKSTFIVLGLNRTLIEDSLNRQLDCLNCNNREFPVSQEPIRNNQPFKGRRI